MIFPKPSVHISDSIVFKSIDTGGQSAGNGGDGHFHGSIVNQPYLSFDPSNTANGASVHNHADDYVTQTVHAGTTATQSNSLMADMHQDVTAGVGGYGGDGNVAWGGNVDISLDT